MRVGLGSGNMIAMRNAISLLAGAFFLLACGSSPAEPPPPAGGSCPTLPLDVHFGGASNATRVAGLSLEVDRDCNLVIAGMTSGAIDFGGGSIGEIGRFAFIVKLDPEGNHIWSRALPPGASLSGKDALALGEDGSVFVAGNLRADVDLGGGKLGGTFDDPVSEIFLLRLDAEGNHVFSRRLVGKHPADVGYAGGFTRYVDSVVVDGQGHFVVAGVFRGDMDLGGKTIENKSYFDGSFFDYRPDVFLAAYDASGTLLWGDRFGGDDYDRHAGLTVLSNGNALLAFTHSPDSMLDGDSGGIELLSYSPAGELVEGKRIPFSYLVGPPSLDAASDGGFAFSGSGRLDLGAAGLYGSTFLARFDAGTEPVFSSAIVGSSASLVSAALAQGQSGMLAIGGFSGSLLVHGKSLAETEGVRGFLAYAEWDDSANRATLFGDSSDELAVALARAGENAVLVAGVSSPRIAPEDLGALEWTEGTGLIVRRMAE